MPASTDPIASVLVRIDGIQASLPVEDGVARFNHLYSAVTHAVDATNQTAGFEDAAFMAALDVGFAGLYFAAVDASAASRSIGRSWAPLFESRKVAGIAPIQFALAGMNAHINHDLPIAVVNTCIAAGVELNRESAQFRDYTRVNDILAAVEDKVKQEYLTGLVGVADALLGRLDDVIANWSIREARAAAWTNAEILWHLRDMPDMSAAFLDALDGTIGLAGRGLLVPTLL